MKGIIAACAFALAFATVADAGRFVRGYAVSALDWTRQEFAPII
jgi:hypothetical protein